MTSTSPTPTSPTPAPPSAAAPAARTVPARHAATTGPALTPAPAPAPAHAERRGHDAALLLVRLVVGLTSATHGSQKLFGWFDGYGLDETVQGLVAVGYPRSDLLGLLVGLSEGLGGLCLALGLLTPLAGAAVTGTMINAVAVSWGEGYLEGFEYPVVLGTAAAALCLLGPGRYAADRALPVLRGHRTVHGVAALVLAAATAGAVLLIRG